MCFSVGVMNYPRKGKKKAAREETSVVCVTCKKTRTGDEFLITQRPDKGDNIFCYLFGLLQCLLTVTINKKRQYNTLYNTKIILKNSI